MLHPPTPSISVFVRMFMMMSCVDSKCDLRIHSCLSGVTPNVVKMRGVLGLLLYSVCQGVPTTQPVLPFPVIRVTLPTVKHFNPFSADGGGQS